MENKFINNFAAQNWKCPELDWGLFLMVVYGLAP